MIECIFCQIIAGNSSSQMLYQDELVSAFRDNHPVAPVHVLVVPNKHIASVNDLTPEDEPLMGHLFTVARQLARQEGIDRSWLSPGSSTPVGMVGNASSTCTSTCSVVARCTTLIGSMD